MKITPRDEDFALRFRRGETMAEIGAVHGVTRERVRQRLKLMGIAWSDGGKHVQHLARLERLAGARAKSQADRQSRREVACLKCFGVSTQEFFAITGSAYNGNRAIQRQSLAAARYLSLQFSAVRRAIPWNLTLQEYWDIWQGSGLWDQCGRAGPGAYCLGRKDASGPFDSANCRICTRSENSANSYIAKPAAARVAKGNATKQAKRLAAYA